MKKEKVAQGFGMGVIFVIIVVSTGLLRDHVISPVAGKYAGHIVSTVITISLIIILTYRFINDLRSKRRNRVFGYYKTDLLFMGIYWFMLTALVELFLRHYLLGDPRVGTFSNYGLVEGGFLFLILLSELLAPYILGAILL